MISGLAESLSILTMLPLLQLGLVRGDNQSTNNEDGSNLTEAFNIFSSLGVEPTLIILLSLIVTMFAVKSLATLIAQAYVGIVSARVSSDLRLDLIKSLTFCILEFFDKKI